MAGCSHTDCPPALFQWMCTVCGAPMCVGCNPCVACRVQDVMTSLEQVFMLERSLRLTFQTMLAIYKSGEQPARVPVSAPTGTAALVLSTCPWMDLLPRQSGSGEQPLTHALLQPAEL